MLLAEWVGFFNALLAPEVLLALEEGGDSWLDSLFGSVLGGLLVPCGVAGTGEMVDGWEEWAMVMPHPVTGSDPWERGGRGVLMSCFEIRVDSEEPLEAVRGLTAGTVSARFLGLRTFRETILRRVIPGAEGPSSSESKSNADTSVFSSCKGGSSG